MEINDFQIIDFIEEKIKQTTGEKQKEWVNKYDVFTSRNLFEKYNQADNLKKTEIIKAEILKMMK
ncbi:hypothetical protein JW813_17640 (plasmid) [Clostridium botulinum]|uniref:hypothetical protein n=1 Tax=Clostridium botulinum TaxID=1491 RepID=UPI0022478E82|nr:hypothetical protein [Clostridium botulinum]UZP05186.1 hypothetical protein JW813_17640 [Clostridium botulinum]UZP08584.1 hypothetical protein JYA71_17940 [Clostridium botulinum]UZP11933.1 hypothetical protein JYA74_17670 [Clostridium botulinum]